MRRSRAMVLIILGLAFVVGGLLGAFFTFGPALLGDCGPECVARGERAVAVTLGFVAVGASLFGAWLARYGVRAWNARVQELRAARMRGG